MLGERNMLERFTVRGKEEDNRLGTKGYKYCWGGSESSLSFTKNKSVFSCLSFYAKGPAAKP
jgi:hypothetical protein